MEEQLEGVWKPRLSAAADPFESSLQRERVRQLALLPASLYLCDLAPQASPRNLMMSEVAWRE